MLILNINYEAEFDNVTLQFKNESMNTLPNRDEALDFSLAIK